MAGKHEEKQTELLEVTQGQKADPSTEGQPVRKHSGRFWMYAATLFFLAALLYAVHNFYIEYKAGVAAEEVYEVLSEKMEERVGSDDDDDSTLPEYNLPIYDRYPNITMPTIEIDGYRYIGILEIPSIDLNLAVQSDWSYDQLDISPCRYSGSVYLHNIVIAGHNYRRHFSPIKWLEPGTEATFTDVDGNKFYYTLSYIDIIAPYDIEGMVTTDGSWDMTLFTCTTGGATRCTLRFVLTGEDPV